MCVLSNCPISGFCAMIGIHVEFCGDRSNYQLRNKFTILYTVITACDYGKNNETAVKGMVKLIELYIK